MKDGWGEKVQGWPRALLSMAHPPVAPALMAWWEGQDGVTHLSRGEMDPCWGHGGYTSESCVG